MELAARGPRSPVRVLLVDPDDRTRESLSGLLRIGNRCIVVGAAGRPDTAVELAERIQPDVLLIDPRLPEIDGGLALILRLRAMRPGIRVLVMAWNGALEHVGLAREADLFIRKTFRASDLVEAVLAASRADASPSSEGERPC